MNDFELFKMLLESISIKYPNRGIKLYGTLVYADNLVQFNTDGFSLLFNIKRLCDILNDELN